jgi:hypothetical protein
VRRTADRAAQAAPPRARFHDAAEAITGCATR